jgi:hypothetical protein
MYVKLKNGGLILKGIQSNEELDTGFVKFKELSPLSFYLVGKGKLN